MPFNVYSIGSSTVSIFCDESLKSLRPAYKVVVFPDPVGPVKRIMPSELFRDFL